jgi:hypothetical protein
MGFFYGIFLVIILVIRETSMKDPTNPSRCKKKRAKFNLTLPLPPNGRAAGESLPEELGESLSIRSEFPTFCVYKN